MWSQGSNATVAYSQGQPQGPRTRYRGSQHQVGLTSAQRAANRRAAVQRVREGMRSAYRQRRAVGSRTALALGTKKGVAVPAGGGESKSSFYLTRPAIKQTKMEKMLGSNRVVTNASGSVACVSGSQNVIRVSTLWDVTDITNALTDVGETATGTNSAKIALLSGTADIMFTNSNASCNAHCIIYDVMSRNDGSDINTNPVGVFQAGGADAVGGATTDYLIPGSTPYANPRFASAYKILQTTPLILHAGATHVHRVRYKPNKVLSRERAVTSDAAGPIGNVTLYSFIVFYGTPVHSAAAETTVSTGIVKLDYVITESLQFKCMQLNYALNSMVNSLTVIADPEQFVELPPTDAANTI